MQSNKEIIIKVISGNASESEMRELEVWRNLSLDNEKEFQETSALWESLTNVAEDISTDEEAAWEKFSHNISQPARNRSYVIYRMAAAIMLITVLSVVAKYVFFNKAAEKPVAVIEPAKEVVKEAAPKYKVVTITSKDSLKQIILPDNSFVILNTNSEFTYYAYADGKYGNCKLSGEAYFDIVPSETGFLVSTDNIVVKVLGTSFNINENNHKQLTEVYVERGKVEVYAKNNETSKLLLSANQKGKFDIKTQSFINSQKKVAQTVTTTESAVETVNPPAKKRWWEKLKEKISKAFGKKKKTESKEEEN